ncbi:MAG: hypothetical protein U0M15_06035 [Bacillota bacterium]|nr:hypothetical protein [Bacillota bacterium]
MYRIALKNLTDRSWLIVPKAPEKIEFSMGTDPVSYDLMTQGETVIPGHRQGRRISFSSTYPKDREKFRVWLETAIEKKQVLRLVLSSSTVDRKQYYGESLNVMIESFRHWEQGGEPNVVFYEIVFKEYRPYALKVVK